MRYPKGSSQGICERETRPIFKDFAGAAKRGRDFNLPFSAKERMGSDSFFSPAKERISSKAHFFFARRMQKSSGVE